MEGLRCREGLVHGHTESKGNRSSSAGLKPGITGNSWPTWWTLNKGLLKKITFQKFFYLKPPLECMESNAWKAIHLEVSNVLFFLSEAQFFFLKKLSLLLSTSCSIFVQAETFALEFSRNQ